MKRTILLETLSMLMLCITCLSSHSQSQIEIDSVIVPGRDAIHIEYIVGNGINMHKVVGDGLNIRNASNDGIRIRQADENGVNISDAGESGVFVAEAGYAGLYVLNADYAGVLVRGAGHNGVLVEYADSAGIFVQDAGGYSMNIQGDKDSTGTIEGHIAQIYNRSTGINPDVLALKVGTASNPGAGVNFITFYHGDDVPMGRIEGNGSGGVTYESSGADYAEYLPVQDLNTQFRPGDLVGVHHGQISHRTQGADQVMVITDQAAVLGNMPKGQGDTDTVKGYEPVSFIGQVQLRVRGPVRAGDWIIPDGNHCGVGIAVSSTKIRPGLQIVGRAWENNINPDIKRVTTLVGLDHSQAKDVIIQNMQRDIEILQEQINALRMLMSGPQD